MNNHYDPFVSNANSTYSRYLETGFYYMEIVSINQQGVGYFKVMMTTPDINNITAVNPTWQVDYFSIK